MTGREGSHPRGLPGGPAVRPCASAAGRAGLPLVGTSDPRVMRPKKGADHARVTLGACGSGVPLAPEGRASEGRAGAGGPPRPDSHPRRCLRGPPGPGPPCLLAPSFALFALVDLGLGTWLASQDHRPPDAFPCGLRVSLGPTEVQVWVGRSISVACRRQPLPAGPSWPPVSSPWAWPLPTRCL